MKSWEIKAIKLLDKSLSTVPQELNEIDWKQDLSTNNKKLSYHLSAFANHPGGGIFAYGIDNTSGRVIGIGKTKAAEIIERLASIARDALSPVVALDHSIIEYSNSPVLIIYVKESSVKPVHMKAGTLEDAYIRSGGTTRKASRHEIGFLMLNSKTLRYEELHASKLLDMTDVLQLLDFHAIHELLGRPVPGNNEEVLEWMEKEKMVKKVNGTGYYITNLGAIAAARNLNQFDDLSRKSIRLIKYDGLNKTETKKEYPGQKGYAIGFEGFIQFLSAMLPQSEIIRDALRKETTLYPEIALRELTANALIHQDFSIMGTGPMVEIFDNRIEFRNPGQLLPSKKIDRLIGTSPESRNERLASTFRRYGICEERGTGFERVIAAIEVFGLPPLHFEEGENYFKVTLYAPKAFGDMSPEERMRACYQHAVIKYLSSSSLTNTSLRERFKMPGRQRSMISRLIKETLEAGKIKPKDMKNKSAKFAEYIPYWG
ncbi:MAG: putative DNA binding domain-containing protein [Desulfobulbaceae bacterium]|nr:putative DNA binding domain-containing protein [Desulfobulbaceae bacterium]